MAGNSPLWLLINLDRSPTRLQTMTRHLDGLGIAFVRVPAVDGHALPDAVPGIDPARYRRSHGRELRPGETGCYLSHLRAMHTFLESPALHAVILEDDVGLSPDIVKIVASLTAADAPDDWDIVKLEARHRSFPLTIRPLMGPYRLATMMLRTTGGAAYLLNRKAAQACLERLLPMRAPFDHAYDRDWALGLRGRAVVPYPASAKDGTNYAPSNIEQSGQPARKVAGLAKLPALGWRARTEIMRVVSALWAKFAPERPFPGFSESQAQRSLYEAARAAIEPAAPSPDHE